MAYSTVREDMASACTCGRLRELCLPQSALTNPATPPRHVHALGVRSSEGVGRQFALHERAVNPVVPPTVSIDESVQDALSR